MFTTRTWPKLIMADSGLLLAIASWTCLNCGYTPMAVFYRGAGPGTYWHAHDARIEGFAPHFPGLIPGETMLMRHIAHTSTDSPYISFSHSFGVCACLRIGGLNCYCYCIGTWLRIPNRG